jgi:PEP-CTERM motif
VRASASILIGLSLAVAFSLATPTMGAILTSVADGGFSDPGTWDSPPAIPVDDDTLHIYHNISLAAGDSYTGGDLKVSLYAGANLTLNGGEFRIGRSNWNGATVALVISDGYLKTARTDNIGAASTAEITGGTFEWSELNPPDLSIHVDGGRYRNTAGGNITNGLAIYTIDSGVFDCGLTTNLFAGSSQFAWNAGTISNLVQSHDYFQNIAGNLGSNAARTLDINDQTLTQAPVTWNMKSYQRDRWGRLIGTAGTIQYDVYGAADNDCDTIISAADNSSLSDGVVIDIGYAGGEITDPSAFLGTTYKLMAMNTQTDFSALTPSVPDAIWNDGTTDWTVSFANNIAVDGTVSIASIIPEPATLAMLMLGGAAILRRRRR